MREENGEISDAVKVAAAVVIIALLLVFGKQLICFTCTKANEMFGSDMSCPCG